jgi:hypothetical protein
MTIMNILDADRNVRDGPVAVTVTSVFDDAVPNGIVMTPVPILYVTPDGRPLIEYVSVPVVALDALVTNEAVSRVCASVVVLKVLSVIVVKKTGATKPVMSNKKVRDADRFVGPVAVTVTVVFDVAVPNGIFMTLVPDVFVTPDGRPFIEYVSVPVLDAFVTNKAVSRVCVVNVVVLKVLSWIVVKKIGATNAVRTIENVDDPDTPVGPVAVTVTGVGNDAVPTGIVMTPVLGLIATPDGRPDTEYVNVPTLDALVTY